MNNRLSLLSLCIISLIIPMAVHGAAVMEASSPQKGEPKSIDITWINGTKTRLCAGISSEASVPSAYLSLSPQKPQLIATIMEHGPYTVLLNSSFDSLLSGFTALSCDSDKSFLNSLASLASNKGSWFCFKYAIPDITSATEIKITENPEGSRNYQVWYRNAQTIEQNSQEAVAVMQATHARIGKEAVSLGGEIGSAGRGLIYKQIAEYLFEKGWQQAAPIPD